VLFPSHPRLRSRGPQEPARYFIAAGRAPKRQRIDKGLSFLPSIKEARAPACD
jgi:hypothetical protein